MTGYSYGIKKKKRKARGTERESPAWNVWNGLGFGKLFSLNQKLRHPVRFLYGISPLRNDGFPTETFGNDEKEEAAKTKQRNAKKFSLRFVRLTEVKNSR